jgi:methylated-DNA-[protein]-cysteine S-methyltransferase
MRKQPSNKNSSSDDALTLELITPLGGLRLSVNQEKVVGAEWLAKSSKVTNSNHPYCQQILAYFRDVCAPITVPVALNGTAFQVAVWQQLLKIPRGKTLTYGELARKLNTSPRAIGQACRTNRIPLLIPCHRIVAQHHLGGYNGDTSGAQWQIKKWLLDWEQQYPQ